MKKPVSIQITVPEPCAQIQHWEEMQHVSGGRHCTQCRQTVVDFTRMTDAALIAFVQQHPVGCGRYREDQIGHDLIIPDIKKSRFGIKWLMTLLMLFFGWMKEGIAQKAGSKSKARHAPVTLTPVRPSLKACDSNTSQIVPPKTAQPAPDLINNTQVYQSGNGGGISYGGARTTTTQYIIDGVQLAPGTQKFGNTMSESFTMEPPGRRTIKGDDLPHSFRFDEETIPTDNQQPDKPTLIKKQL